MVLDDSSSKDTDPTASVSLSATNSFAIDPEWYNHYFITDEEEAYYRKEISLKTKRIESLAEGIDETTKSTDKKVDGIDATTKSTVKELDSLVKDLEDVIKRLEATKNLAEAHSRVLKENAMLKKKIATLEKAQTSGPALRDQTNQLTEAERRMKVKKNADEHVIRNSSKAKASARRRA